MDVFKGGWVRKKLWKARARKLSAIVVAFSNGHIDLIGLTPMSWSFLTCPFAAPELP